MRGLRDFKLNDFREHAIIKKSGFPVYWIKPKDLKKINNECKMSACAKLTEFKTARIYDSGTFFIVVFNEKPASWMMNLPEYKVDEMLSKYVPTFFTTENLDWELLLLKDDVELRKTCSDKEWEWK